jgi:hypothetical protein
MVRKVIVGSIQFYIRALDHMVQGNVLFHKITVQSGETGLSNEFFFERIKSAFSKMM